MGKTLVSSAIIDRVVTALGRQVYEVPVGFKWFSPGLFAGTLCFGGEESAGASFLRRDGRVWTTDKDGIILGLLAAEIRAVTGKDPGEHYRALTERFGTPCYTRIDAPASPEQKAAFRKLVPGAVERHDARGRPDHRQTHPRPRQRRRHRRTQGGLHRRLVRRAPLRHRERLQALRRELPGRGAPRGHRRPGAGDPDPGAGDEVRKTRDILLFPAAA